MGFFESFGGEVTLKVTSAAAENLLTALSENGIRITDVRIIDELTVVLCVSRKDSKNAQQIIRRKGGDAKTVRRKGVVLFVSQVFTQTGSGDRYTYTVSGYDDAPHKDLLLSS